mmetsp:Transcript_15147/g.59302  ORF Transcript_15147/g.59302 Transcript_15147/m.59302 type:complete len:435 (+) Transcript_15147:54-1358(+)|eukprot:CAMPEP_0114606470 /NCGR_PEP_ID=MMETSP0168-20121206/1580_1 /TAXON_ID=95228 ORGANISM="Vannella sp., Strain DIVA3 517/6/12" /NCGR_SAMPLE_ID=MMETSP0168 /ASSEMBLY_ACC=CAM_ASM_000044 /LENGTH=434 /DNA_ID=CAMNT_0001817339 /DNA_START=59 /DNA_END=1363 /DNA_ORIENTATION=+
MESSLEWILAEQARVGELRMATKVLFGQLLKMMDEQEARMAEWAVRMQEGELVRNEKAVKWQRTALAKDAVKNAAKKAERAAKEDNKAKKKVAEKAAVSSPPSPAVEVPLAHDMTTVDGDHNDGEEERNEKKEEPEEVHGVVTDAPEQPVIGEEGEMGKIDFAQFCANKEQAAQLQRQYEEDMATKRLIAQLQEEERAAAAAAEAEKEKRAQMARTASDSFVAGSLQPIECPICIDEVDVDFSHHVDACGHVYCRDCICHYVTDAITTKRLPIRCPDPRCTAELGPYDVELLVNEELYKKYCDFSLATLVEGNAEYSCCPTADCKYVFLHQAGDPCRLDCPACKKSYCLDCKADWHTGIDCKAFQAWAAENRQGDELFDAFATGQRYKQCPACGVWVEKKQGCNHITCRCKAKFCYHCGDPYPCVCGHDPHVKR